LIDATDRAILNELRLDPQASNRALGAAVGVSEVTVNVRISRLREAGAMRILLQRNIDRLGFTYFGYFIIEGTSSSISVIAKKMAQLRATHSVMIVDEGQRVFVTAGSRDSAQLMDFIDKDVGGIKGAKSCSFTLICDIVKYATGTGAVANHSSADGDLFELDDTDRTDKAIIDILTVDARISNREVSRQLGISESLVRVRLKKLIDNKIVKFAVVTDPRFFDGITFSFVKLRVPLKQTASLCERLRASPDCGFAGRSSGDWNLCALAIFDTNTRLADVLRDSWGLSGIDYQAYEPTLILKHRIDLVKIE
jgi:Lrp/AsnC family transcriptional regulator for asnA, asnC and gidA